jgi:peptidoglycan/LPS O-acetylase OafA/YrhL
VFFVLSGMLLAQSWATIRSRYPRLWEAIQEYGISRVLRIGPAYWVMLIILIAIRGRWLLASDEGRVQLAMFFSFQQFLDPKVPDNINSVTWSLTPEVHFYVLLPLLAVVLRKLGRARALALALASSLAWRVFVYPMSEVAEWLPGRIDLLMAGMATASLVAEHHAGHVHKWVSYLTARRAWLVPTGLIAWMMLQWGSSFGVRQPYWLEVAFHPIVGLSVAALLARALCLGRTKPLEGRVVRFFGVISYSFYLWHAPFILEAIRHDLSGPALVYGLTALVAGALAVSVISYRLVEKPALDSKRRLRSWLRRKTRSPSGSPSIERS